MIEPEVGRPVTDLGMVQGVVVRPGRVQVSLALLVAGHPQTESIRQDVADAVRSLDAGSGADGGGGVGDVVVDTVAMNDRDRARLRRTLQPERPEPAEVFRGIRTYAVVSGKGGVGKSSIATNLAVALARRGERVALLDADVWGFSVPRMMGVRRGPVIVDGLLLPVSAHGVRVVSVGMLTEESEPVIWRGPMLHKLLEQFVADVFWDDPDVLVVDMPPGTGDVSLTVTGLLPDAELVVVTTPQPAAQRVAQRAARMAAEVDLHLAGVVENMSWFTGDDGVRYELFGGGGGARLAQELGAPLLGQIPLVPALREGADFGDPVVVGHPDGEAARALDAVAGRLLDLRASVPLARTPERRLRITTAG